MGLLDLFDLCLATWRQTASRLNPQALIQNKFVPPNVEPAKAP
jgi:hypothetical protein